MVTETSAYAVAIRSEVQRLLAAAISTSKGNSSELWKMLQGVLGEANSEVSDAHTADDFSLPPFSRTKSTLFGPQQPLHHSTTYRAA